MRRASIFPDHKWPGLYRVQYPDGSVSDDVVNLTRAKDTVRRIELNGPRYRVRTSRIELARRSTSKRQRKTKRISGRVITLPRHRKKRGSQ